MFKEILLFKPRLDPGDLKKLEKLLQGRFAKLAKNFGRGIVNVFKGGGIAGVALAFINKVLNPIKEVQEAIDRTLKASGDIVTNAKLFNTSTGNLLKLTQLGKSAGLEEKDIFEMLNKFQNAVNISRIDPNDVNGRIVKNYQNQNDTAEALYNFMGKLRQMDPSQSQMVQRSLFGEKDIIKLASFVETDLEQRAKSMGFDKISTEKLSSSLEKLDKLDTLNNTLTASRELQDYIDKSRVINEGMTRAMNDQAKLQLQRENQRIKNYENLQGLSNTVDKIMVLIENQLGLVGSLLNRLNPFIDKVVGFIDKFQKSPMIRGLFKLGKGD